MDTLPAYLKNLPTNFSVKATIFKIIEVKASKDDIDIKASLKKGPIKLSMDADGNVGGDLGPLSLKGDPTLQALGGRIKFLSVTLSLADNGDIKYDATISSLGAANFTMTGQFDIEKLLLDRGLLKRAYDPIKNRQKDIEDAVNAANR